MIPKELHFKTKASMFHCMLFGEVGFGDEFVKGNITVDGDLAEFIQKNSSRRFLPYFRKSLADAKHHYNLPSEMYELILGDSMAYTCANFGPRLIDVDNSSNLENAQFIKHWAHAFWLGLNTDQTLSILDCGCGFGGFVQHVSDKFQHHHITGVNVSESQIEYARKKNNGLPNVEYINASWEDINHQFDRFVSICSLEHVGKGNIDKHFQWVNKILKPNGIGAIQFISSDKPMSAWFDKHIFPGAYPPDIYEVRQAMSRAGFVVTDSIEIGQTDYVKTLKCWLKNIYENMDKIKLLGISDETILKFILYFNGAIAAFNSCNSLLFRLRFVRG